MAEKESPIIPKNIFPHMFRHSKAMHLLESGVNYVYIRDFLGHSNIKTTEVLSKRKRYWIQYILKIYL